MVQRTFWLALAAVVVLGVGLRIAFVATAAQPLPDPGDAMAYHRLGAGLADGAGYIRPYDRLEGRSIATAEYGPAHPGVLAVANLAGIDTPIAQRYLGAVLGGIGIALTGLAGRRLRDTATGVVAAVLVAGSPQLVQHDTTLLTEGLAVAVASAILVAALAVARRAAIAPAAALGAVVGVAALARADAILLLVVLVVPLCMLQRRQHGLRALAAAVFAFSVVVAPWVIRNAVRLDAFVGISTNAATAIDGANCPSTYAGSLIGYWRFADGCFEGYDTPVLIERGEAPVARAHMSEGLDFATEHATRVPLVMSARVLRLWGAWNVDQQVFLAALEGKSAPWERAGVVVAWIVDIIAVGGVIVVVRRRPRASALILLAPLLVVTISAMATYGNPRFRAGAEPALAVLAAVALVTAAEGVRRRRAER